MATLNTEQLLAARRTASPSSGGGVPVDPGDDFGYNLPNDFDPLRVPKGWVAKPRIDSHRHLYTRRGWRDVAARVYEEIIDDIGLQNLKCVLPMWELEGGPFRNIVNYDKTFSPRGQVLFGQPGGPHPIPYLDGSTAYIVQDPVIANPVGGTYDTSLTANTNLLAQQFIAPASCVLGFARVYIRKTGSPGGNIAVQIYSDNAGQPNAVITSGTTNNLANSSIASAGWVGLTFNTGPSLVAGTTYWVVIEYTSPSGIDGSDHVDWYYDVAGTFGLNRATYNGSSWTVQTGTSFAFELYDKDALDLGTANPSTSSYTVILGAKSDMVMGTSGYLLDISSTIGGWICQFRVNSANTWQSVQEDSGAANLNIALNQNPKQYHVWAMTFAYGAGPNKTCLYKDGYLVGSVNGTAGNGLMLQAAPATLGAIQGSYGIIPDATLTTPFKGWIGPFVYANSALSSRRISAISNQLLALRRYQEAV
jgi:hypothetical protein